MESSAGDMATSKEALVVGTLVLEAETAAEEISVEEVQTVAVETVAVEVAIENMFSILHVFLIP